MEPDFQLTFLGFGLAEFDGIDVYDIADLSPIEIKLDDTTQTFNLE